MAETTCGCLLLQALSTNNRGTLGGVCLAREAVIVYEDNHFPLTCQPSTYVDHTDLANDTFGDY